MKNCSRRSFLKSGAAVAGGAVASRSVPTWAPPAADPAPAVVPNSSAFAGLPEPAKSMINVEAKA